MSNNKEEKAEGNWICNLRTCEFLGRTPCSWALIFLFYVVFYGFLAGFFILTLWVMLQTLDDKVPKYRDRVSSPGLTIRPIVDSSLDIYFNRSELYDYMRYIRRLEEVLRAYDDEIQEANELCMVGQYYIQDSQDEYEKKVCQFKRSLLRRCDGLSDPLFGYDEGQPCILLKLNRIIGLMPWGDPYINCTIQQEHYVHIQYFPSDARIDKMYFPYYGKKAQPRYVQPLVAIKLLLTKADYDKELTVECKVEGSNMQMSHRDRFLGRVTFRVKVVE